MRIAVRAVLLLAGVPVAVLTQARLGAYATGRGGAATVRADPQVVVLSLASAALVALTLQWPSVRIAGRRWGLATLRAMRRVPARATRWMRRRVQLARPDGWRLAFGRMANRVQLGRWPWRVRAAALTLVFALGVSVLADVETRTPELRPQAQIWWLLSVALLLAAALLASRRSTGQQTLWETPRWRLPYDGLALATLAAGALALRLPNLTGLPYSVHGDEAACGLEALRWLHGDIHSLLEVGWYGLPVAGYGLPVPFMRLVGADLYGLRLSSVVIGTLSVLVTYALAREIGGRRMAFLAAGFLAVAHAHVHFSRMGIHYIHAVCVVALVFWLLLRMLRTRSEAAAVLAAAAMSLAVQVYFSARVVFVVVPLFLLCLLFLRAPLLRGSAGVVGWLFIGLIVALGPLAQYFLLDTAPLTARTNDVSLFSMTPYLHDYLVGQFGTATLWPGVLSRQLAAVPLIAGGLADQSLQYGPYTPLLDPLVAALATIGLFLALLRLRRPAYLLLALWVGAVIGAGVVTIDMPWWPRLLVMLPALCILAALVLEEISARGERAARALLHRVVWPRRAAFAGACAIALGVLPMAGALGYSGGHNVDAYFADYPRHVNADGYRTRYTDIAYYLAQLPAGTRAVLFEGGDMVINYETIRFLAPQIQGQQVDTIAALEDSLRVRAGTTIVLVPVESLNDFQQLLGAPGEIPAGQLSAEPDANGLVTFFTYTMPG
jgi:4-amino-4-deoxy-L-arabinose transferase-like glycosyltransferase